MSSPRSSLRFVRLQGWLLAASPCVTGHPFPKSVYWITEHGPDGAAGVMLNDPLNQRFHEQCQHWILEGRSRELLEDLAESAHRASESRATSSGRLATRPQVTMYSSRVHVSLDDASAGLGRTLRLFLGQTRWRPGTLESQWRGGAWVVAPATPELVMGDLSRLWSDALRASRTVRDLVDADCDVIGRPIAWN